MVMRKIGLIAFTTALLLSGASFAADPITLICNGSASDRHNDAWTWKVINQSVVIDLDKKIISAWGVLNDMGQPLSITDQSEDSISFKGNGLLSGQVDGDLNRVTGEAWFMTPTDYYRVTCKPAKPLF
jgi:hypothetical protein